MDLTISAAAYAQIASRRMRQKSFRAALFDSVIPETAVAQDRTALCVLAARYGGNDSQA